MYLDHPPFLTYLFVASVLLLVFAFGYYLFLRQAPALALRRRVLLFGIVGVLLLPLCPAPPIPRVVENQVPATQVVESWEMETLRAAEPFVAVKDVPSGNSTVRSAVSRTLSPQGVLILGYRLIALLFLGRIVLGLLRLARIRRRSRATGESDLRVIDGWAEAFTFGRTVYLSRAVYDSADVEVILAHERAHARQFHTLDALLVEIFRAVFWFHPMAWWLRDQVQINLEYLADAAVLRAGYDRRAYQLSLVAHQQGTDFRTSLLPQFAAKGLRRRIQMMQFRAGTRVRGLVGVGVLVFVCFFAFAAVTGQSAGTETNASKPGIAPLFNGEATELNIYFKRLPTPEEVALIQPYLSDYFQKDISVYQRCSEPAGSYHLHLGRKDKSLSGIISWPTSYHSDEAVRFHFTKNGLGNSGSSTFSPKLPPAGAPDADVFLSVNGEWKVIDMPGSEPYTKATLDPLPVQAKMECLLGVTPENKDSHNRFTVSTQVDAVTLSEEFIDGVLEGYAPNSPRSYYIVDRQVDEATFFAYKSDVKRQLYLSGVTDGPKNRVVLLQLE